MLKQEVDKLIKLEYAKQLTFAYLTCERLYPNFLLFSNKYSFGNPTILREAIDYIGGNIIEHQALKEKTGVLIDEVEKNIPETAKYETVLASSALDACTVINESLDFLIDKNVSRLIDISTMATDSVHMYIQEAENLDFNTDKLFQKKIDTHPLMTKEILIQKGIIHYLATIDSITTDDIKTLINLQGNSKGNLSL